MSPRKKVKLSNSLKQEPPQGSAVSRTSKPVDGSYPGAASARKGCLESVQALPLDISFEIFGHLHPKDLLNFARTSKAFRSFFLTRANSISIWKASLSRVEGLPEKPPFLSEPTFAHVLFYPFCQNCGKSGIQKPIWPWFVRYCTNCVHSLSWTYDEACAASSGDLTVLMPNQFEALFNIHQTTSSRGYHLFHKPQLERFAREWKETKGNKSQRNILIKKQRNATTKQAKLAQRFEAWHTAQQKHRSEELEDIRQQRLQDIVERLGRRRSEWLPEIEYFGEDDVAYHISDVPVVRQASRLTARAWPRVLAALESELEPFRACRLQEERQEQITGRLHELETAIIEHYVRLPKTAAMDCRPNARILLDEKKLFDLVVAPSDREVTSSDFAKGLPEICVRWEAACAEGLRRLMRAAMPAIPDDVDPLRLAVAVFECDGPGQCAWNRCSASAAHRYPDLLAHTCLCSHPRRDSQKEDEDRIGRTAEWLSRWDGFEKYKGPSRMKISNIIGIAYSGSPMSRMKHIVSALGLDPTRATPEDLGDGWVRCRACASSSRQMFSWEAALYHTHDSLRYSGFRDIWEKVDGADLATIRELQAKRDPPSKDKVRWGCSLCQDWDSIGDEVESHLKEEHQMEDFDKCIEDGTVYLHYNQPHSSSYPMVLPGADGLAVM